MTEDKVVEEGRVWAIIAYLWILFLVPLLGKKDNKFALYHAKQGLMFFIATIVLWIAGAIISVIFAFIPFAGWAISAIIWVLIWVFILVLFIVGIVNAATGKYAPLPVIGQIAEKWKI